MAAVSEVSKQELEQPVVDEQQEEEHVHHAGHCEHHHRELVVLHSLA